MTVGTLMAASGPKVEGRDWAEISQLAGVTAQLVLMLVVIRLFQLESRTFYNLAVLAVSGFLVNALLPMRYRLVWFVAVSLVGIGLAFGMAGGLWLTAAGLGLIAICHLPLAFHWRVLLLILAGAALATMRGGWMPSPFPIDIWPILGSMFMFRLIMYMHALRHDETPPSMPRRLGYFFMLPNVIFPLFPLVDYKVFERSHYEVEPVRTYQRGVQWIGRGMLHLVLYRVVYHYLVLDPSEITGLATLLQHFSAAFLLYLRVSGQFHIAIGMLHLFGFHLPETHHLYYLASSFTDFWRRINIYWKDFIMKYVYYPSFLRLRRRGVVFGVVMSIAAVFVITWLLHSYQWFWLRGAFPVTATDVLFWLVISIFLLFHVLKETKQGRTRVLVQQKRWSLKRGLAAVAMFTTVSVLWGLWDSSSIADFLSLFQLADRVTITQALVILGIAAAYALVAGFPWGIRTLAERQNKVALPFWRQPSVQTTALLSGLFVAGWSGTQSFLFRDQQHFIQSLQEDALNKADAATMQRGYYEQLIDVKRYNTELWHRRAAKPRDWALLPETEIFRSARTLLGGELVPGAQMNFKGALLTTNQWGMRDRDYTLEKPAGVRRVALLGPSDVMGEGVAITQTFENVLEDSLNRRRGSDWPATEILNFGVSSYTVVQQAMVAEDRVWRFDPDVLVLVYHPAHDRGSAFRTLARSIRAGVPIEDSALTDIIRRARVDSSDSEILAFRKLRPYALEIVESAFRRIGAATRARRVPAILLVMDLPKEKSRPRDRALPLATRHGFMLADIRDSYGAHDMSDLTLAVWDKHPNVVGHRLLARRFGEELARLDTLLYRSRHETPALSTSEAQ